MISKEYISDRSSAKNHIPGHCFISLLFHFPHLHGIYCVSGTALGAEICQWPKQKNTFTLLGIYSGKIENEL